MPEPTIPESFVRLTELDAAWAEPTPGVRLAAIRRAARALHDRIAAAGAAVCVRTADMGTAPYPVRFGLEGAARSPLGFLFIRNRMQLVQIEHAGRVTNVLVNPTDAARVVHTPYFARLMARFGLLGPVFARSSIHGTPADALASWGVSPADIDYVTFDHMHTQDVRGLLAPGGVLPRARLIIQRAELDTFRDMHPHQRDWYQPDGLDGVAPDRIVVVDGDYSLGPGLAIVRTPGHTRGNHSPVVVTDRGLWTISENGVCVDAYAPGSSAIRGLRAHARSTGVEVILNSNTRENSLDQYTSMVLEKTLADPSTERPEFPQHFCSSELVRHPLAPGLAPTFSHRAITHGQVRTATAASSHAA
jgi:glyoxylase-like metal-dependent hydrolase (beta-lactamase superfamily II)